MDHELVKKGVTTPLGRIIEAKRDNVGAFVKVLLNEAYPDFKNIFYQLKNKFIDALSITFRKPEKGEYVIQKGIRYLKKINLINVAATPYPANTGCSILSVFTKSLSEIEEEKIVNESKKPTEGTKMAEKEKKESGNSNDDLVTQLAEMKSTIDGLKTELAEFKDTPINTQLDNITAAILKREEFKDVKSDLEKKDSETEIEEMKSRLNEISEVLHAPQHLAVQTQLPSEIKTGTETKDIKRPSGPLDYI